MKLPKGNFLLFFGFTVVSLCVLLIFSVFGIEQDNRLSRNNLYTGHEKSFTVGYAEDENLWSEVFQGTSEDMNNFTIYNPIDNPDIIIRGVYIKGSVVNPPMLWGEYFSNDTSWTDNPSIVVGKNFQKNIVTNNETKYYEYGGENYQVIGIMGTQKDSWINNMIMLDFKSAAKITGVNTSYVLDTKRKSDIIKVGSELSETIKYPASIIIILEEEYEKPLVEKLFSSDVLMDTIYIMILISFSLSTVLVTYIWLNYRKQFLFACKLYGYRKRSIHYEIYKRYLSVTDAGFLTGILIMCVIAIIMNDFRIEFMCILKSLVSTVCLGAAILTFCYMLGFKKHNKC